MAEAFFRITESLLETRPLLSKYDGTITGHIFSSFLALLLRHELMSSLASRGDKPEWADIVCDLQPSRKSRWSTTAVATAYA